MTALHHQELARQALQAFGWGQAAASFIQHSENITFRVEHPDGRRAVLRLHLPLVPEFGAHGADANQIRFETAWLQALQAAGLPVPRPWQTPQGDTLVTLHQGADPVHATLLAWLPGETLQPPLRAAHADALGQLVGRIHAHGSRWQPPAGLLRPAWDLPRFQAALQTIAAMQQDGRLTHQDIYPMQRAVTLLGEIIQRYRPEQGLLHGDLYLGNVLWHNEQPQLIDFSMCGPGYYLYDLAACLEHIPYHHHATFLEAYRRRQPLSDQHLQLLPGFYIAHALVSLAIWVNHPPAQEALIQRLGMVRRAAEEFIHSY